MYNNCIIIHKIHVQFAHYGGYLMHGYKDYLRTECYLMIQYGYGPRGYFPRGRFPGQLTLTRNPTANLTPTPTLTLTQTLTLNLILP